MISSCFIAGTDTDAGKTVVTSAILRYLAKNDISSAGLKPIASGFDYVGGRRLNQDIESIRRASAVSLPDELINVYGFEPAVAPHIAAKDAGVTLSIPSIVKAFRRARNQADVLVVEGVGGWRVPLQSCGHSCELPCLTHTETMASVALALNLPVVLVVGLKLGCLNHALLTAQAILDDGLPLLGWVANNLSPDFARQQENMETLHWRMPAPLLFEVPYLQTTKQKEQFVPSLNAV